MSWRTVARRSDDVWLVTEEPGEGVPQRARVLDLTMMRAYSPQPAAAVLERLEWQLVADDDRPDGDALMRDVEVMPDDEPMGTLVAVRSDAAQ